MSTSKRVILIVVRWLTVVVAVGFLVFYVGQARRKRMEMLSGSKNARALYSTESQFLPAPAAGDPAIVPVPVIPPASSPQSHANQDTETTTDPFSFGIYPQRPITLGGSKSGVPVMESSVLLRSLNVTPKTTSHTFGLPALRALPPELTFSEPSIRVEAEPIEKKEPEAVPATPPPTSLTTPSAVAPQPAP